MEQTLDNNYYAFPATEDHAATVTVNTGSLDYSYQTSGPFQKAGTIAAGESQDFDAPVVLVSFVATT